MSIRLRLALWYTGFLALMFLIFAPLAYLTLERQTLAEVDRWLSPLSERVMEAVRADPKLLEAPTLSSNPADLARAVAGISEQEKRLESFTSQGVFVELLDPNGRVILRSPNLDGKAIPVPDGAFASAWWGAPASFTSELEGTRYRGLLAPMGEKGDPHAFVLVSRSLEQVDGSLAGFRLLLVAGNLLGLLLAVGVGWLIARNGLRPIEEITRAARSIALSQGFGQRLKVGQSRDEVGRLALTVNEMLASLDAAYAAQRRFVADASHELRSPLTSIRSNIDILRRALDAPREDREEALADVSAELERMSRLISDLLLLARADAGQRMEMGKVALDELVRDVHRQMEPQAGSVALQLGPVRRTTVKGNADWLKQLLLILVDNALKYTPRGGSVWISLDRSGDGAVLTVRDTGMGISPEDLPHVFERFYRADKARAREEGGAGLGLAIAKWIAEEHHGDLTVESELGRGTTFSLRLRAIGNQLSAVSQKPEGRSEKATADRP